MEFTEQELKAIRSEFCRGFTDDQFNVFMTFCRVRNLMPGKHVVGQIRKSSEWDEVANAKVKTEKVIFITTIDAARLIAQRSGEYTGQAPEQYIYLDDSGLPNLISEIPLPDPKNKQLPREPWAVRTSIYRKGFDHPITSVARFDAYAVTRRVQGGGLVLTDMWQRRAPEMLAKCCEMLGLRKAFPEELAGIFVESEFKPDPEDVTSPVTPAAVLSAQNIPLPPTVPVVNQAPAEPTNNPRLTDPEVKQTPPEPKASASEKAEKAAFKPVKKSTKKGAEPASPVSGKNEWEITDEDIENACKPRPEFDEAANKREAQEFVEAVTSFTPEEAVAQGLPVPPDPLPTKEEMKKNTDHVRELTAAGAMNGDLKNYFLKISGKTDPKFLTVGDWKRAFDELDKAKADGRLKEFLKENK